MEIRQDKAGGVATLFLSGRFDFHSHRQLKDVFETFLANAEIGTVEINLAGVSYLDSSGLGILLLLRERGEGANKKIVLRSPNDTVTQILAIANFGKLFAIVA